MDHWSLSFMDKFVHFNFYHLNAKQLQPISCLLSVIFRYLIFLIQLSDQINCISWVCYMQNRKKTIYCSQAGGTNEPDYRSERSELGTSQILSPDVQWTGITFMVGQGRSRGCMAAWLHLLLAVCMCGELLLFTGMSADLLLGALQML